MATLTGFKQVGEKSVDEQRVRPQQQQQQQQQNGQQNPVFVFDEIELEDGQEFVDASSHLASDEQRESKRNAKKGDKRSRNDPTKEKIANNSTVTINIQDHSDNGTRNETSDKQEAQSTTPPPAAQLSRKQQQKPNDTSKQTQSATGNQLQKGAVQNNSTTQPANDASGGQAHTQTQNQQQNQQQQNQSSAQNSLAPQKDEGDNISLLAIDCVGTGKSPRTPRRSPLMALFRGKPRESTRKTYTDQDQFEIEWANLSLEVQRKWYQKFSLANLVMNGNGTIEEKPRMILKGVDGRIRSGEITAILGPSGAGKTSLLNSLFGKYRTAIQGSVRVTGAPTKKHLTVCTIPQSDFLIGYLTTEESLWFASRLKNCEHDFNHDRNIERVVELLGLQRCRHTRINKLSGGQYKRVSIAQEMLSSPDILVLDEPTSGLDSLTCYRTVKVLRDLVEASQAHNLVNPMSIVLTIHQPHREVLDLFHSVYVMAVGGQTMYQGPPGFMEDCINKYSGTNVPAQGYNPASFMVELASEEYGRKPIDALVAYQREQFRASTKQQYNFTNYWDEKTKMVSENDLTNLYNNNNNHNNHHHQQQGGKKNHSDSQITLYPLDKHGNNKYVEIDLSGGKNMDNDLNEKLPNKDIDSRIMTPRSGKNSDGVFWRHVSLMSKRCFLSNTRDPLLCTIRVGAHIFIPLVVALIYGPKMGIPNGCPFYKPEINLLEYASMGVEEIQEKHDDIRIQFQNVGLHFMVYYAFGLCMLAFTAISFPLIMHVLVKEIRNGWYSLSTFIVGKMIAELPMAIILPPLSVGIIYIMTGQPSSYLQWRYLVQSLILILIVMIAEAKGLIFGAVCMNSMQTAVFAASVSTVPFILLSGFLIRIREVPYVLQHLAHFSYFKHAVEALIITRYGFGMCPCDPDLIPVGGTPRIIGIPPQIMSLTDYYINAYVGSPDNNSTQPEPEETNVIGNNRNINTIVESITTLAPELLNLETSTTVGDEVDTSGSNENGSARNSTQRRRRRAAAAALAAPGSSTGGQQLRGRSTTTTEIPETTTTNEEPKQGVFFDKLATLLTRANAFGFSITTCDDVEPFTMKDMMLTDSMLPPVIGYLFLSIVVMKFLSYFIVEICVKLKL